MNERRAEAMATLGNLRDVAERLTVATPGERWLRSLLIELLTVLLGDQKANAHWTDIETSGALFEAPAHRSATAMQPAPLRTPAPNVAPLDLRAQAAAKVLSLGDAVALANQRRRNTAEQPAAAPLQSVPPEIAGAAIVADAPAPDASVPDPAGAGWLSDVVAGLDSEEANDENNTKGA